MRTLFVSRVTLPEGVRGNAQYSLFFTRGLETAGHEVRTAITLEAVGRLDCWDAPARPEEFAIVRELLQGDPPDLLVVNYSYMAPLLSLAPEGVARAVLAHDARHLRHAKFLETGCRSDCSPWTEEQEREVLRHADLVIAIQSEEAAAFRDVAPHARTVVLPCCFPLDALPLPEDGDACLFVGSDADHNRQGIGWFLDAVWPEVLRLRPTAMLNVCGTVCGSLRDRDVPGLRLHGRVDDLTPHFAANGVGVVPLLAGSGCKLKLVETLSRARPCVTTSTGAQGLDPAAGGLVVADDPAEFAAALARLFADRALLQARSEAAFAHAKARFDPEKAHTEFRQTLDALRAAGHARHAAAPGSHHAVTPDKHPKPTVD
ncbi:hypothetical protein dsx2_1140 [Desulfovibrio sp. X2]|uniref:glycosyltransferase n=1 Tax=Desulfovibrio sp. X2 TaxID=941449 RepID=UPI000358F134|nr:glycosyltransferase [Desulfovibrio sp. X2]EPR37197.1 hypothetical protein dsx2_1140 [Desulfovibrio sp. X2]